MENASPLCLEWWIENEMNIIYKICYEKTVTISFGELT